MTPELSPSLACNDPRFSLHADLAKPDFLLIGGAKCGTTSFAAYLPAHPQVAPWQVKEPNYWSWRKPNASQYQVLFTNVKPPRMLAADQQIAGDYSTSSLLHPMVPRRVAAALPDIKIVVMLRNPIDRAYSHYVMSQRSGLEDHQPFDAIVSREIELAPELLAAHQRGFTDPSGDSAQCYKGAQNETLYFPLHNADWTLRPFKTDTDLQAFYYTSYIFRSIYCDQLSRWLTLFPRKQVHIIQSEKFFKNPADHMATTARFLGLEDFDFGSSDELKSSFAGSALGDWAPPEKYPPLTKKTRQGLREFFAPYNERLYELVGEDYGWR